MNGGGVFIVVEVFMGVGEVVEGGFGVVMEG